MSGMHNLGFEKSGEGESERQEDRELGSRRKCNLLKSIISENKLIL